MEINNIKVFKKLIMRSFLSKMATFINLKDLKKYYKPVRDIQKRNHQFTNNVFKMKKQGLKYFLKNEIIKRDFKRLSGLYAALYIRELENSWFCFFMSRTGHISLYCAKFHHYGTCTKKKDKFMANVNIVIQQRTRQ